MASQADSRNQTPRKVHERSSRSIRAKLTIPVCFTMLTAPVTPMATMASDASGTTTAVRAKQARRIHLVENAGLRLTNNSETTLDERGHATGTFNAPVTARLNFSPNHVTAVFTIYPKGGSISGKAQARYVVKNGIGYYGGTLTITRGTGAYKHASGSNIGISGTINRLTFAVTVKVNGPANV